MALLLIDFNHSQKKHHHNELLKYGMAGLLGVCLLGFVWQLQTMMPKNIWIMVLVCCVLICCFFLGRFIQEFLEMQRFKRLIAATAAYPIGCSGEDDLEQKRFERYLKRDSFWQSVVAGLGVAALGGLLSGVADGLFVWVEAAVAFLGLGVAAYESSQFDAPLNTADLSEVPQQNQTQTERLSNLLGQEENTHQTITEAVVLESSQRLENQVTTEAKQEALFEAGDRMDLARLETMVPDEVIHEAPSL